MMICKNRAFRPVASGDITSSGHYPDGVGGMEGKPIFCLRTGDWLVYFTAAEIARLVKEADEFKRVNR